MNWDCISDNSLDQAVCFVTSNVLSSINVLQLTLANEVDIIDRALVFVIYI